MRSNLRSKKYRRESSETFQRIYQNKDGSYLPDSSQPDESRGYEIVSNVYTPHKSTRYINIGIEEIDDKPYIGKELPKLYENRENCCGCTACYAICPVSAIVMRPDEEGFLYPVVDAMKCIRCYKCLSVCAFKEAQKEKGYLK